MRDRSRILDGQSPAPRPRPGLTVVRDEHLPLPRDERAPLTRVEWLLLGVVVALGAVAVTFAALCQAVE